MRMRRLSCLAAMALSACCAPIPAAWAQGPVQPAPEEREVGDATEGLHAVVPPGQEEILAGMLGKGEPLAGCNFAGGGANGGTILATYTCPSGEVVLELIHPDLAASGATLTDRFAIALKTGAPPEGFVPALAARIRMRESGFEWLWVGTRREPSARGTSVVLAIGLLAAAGFVWLLRSRSAARRSSAPD